MIVCTRPKVRRNGVCRFCASGKKFKHCHGAPQSGPEVAARYAGNAHEKPALFSYTQRLALGPIPVEKAK